MKREGTLAELTDGKFYRGSDLARVGSNACSGCSACCHDTVDTIFLDPFDCFQLCTHLQLSFEALIKSFLELGIMDGAVLPRLKPAADTGNCPFLNQEQRCSIHAFRPGFCRLFPLGRYYSNGSFQYILQTHQCPKKNKSKVKIQSWIGIGEFASYEAFVNDWHYFLLDIEALLATGESDNEKKSLAMYLLNTFYNTPYGKQLSNEDFFSAFSKRLQKVRSMLGLSA